MSEVWTAADYQAWLRTGREPQPQPMLPSALASPPPVDRYKSKTERRFAIEIAEAWKHEGRIRAWFYEPMKGLYLAPSTSYTPDFLFDTWDRLVFIETKGAFIREKDWIKVKLAAALYPCFEFKLCQWAQQQWRWRDLPRPTASLSATPPTVDHTAP